MRRVPRRRVVVQPKIVPSPRRRVTGTSARVVTGLYRAACHETCCLHAAGAATMAASAASAAAVARARRMTDTLALALDRHRQRRVVRQRPAVQRVTAAGGAHAAPEDVVDPVAGEVAEAERGRLALEVE